MTDQIRSTVQKTRAYWFTDGIVEILIGVLFLVTAFFMYIQAVAPPSIRGFVSLGFPLVIFFGALASRKVTVALKERITFPRTGYIEYQKPRSFLIVAALIIGLVFGGLIAWLVISEDDTQIIAWMPILQGFVLAFLWSLIAYQSGGVTRLYWIALASIGLGIAQKILWDTQMVGSAFFYSLLGLILIVSGGLTLRSFLETNQASTDTE